MKPIVVATALLLCIAVAQSAPAEPTPAAAPLNKVPSGAHIASSPSGLQYVDVTVGKGEVPQPGDLCIVHYTAWTEDGKEVSNSRNPRPVDPRDASKGTKALPFGFKLGSGQVIRGWDEGVSTMREGGVRLLFIPPQLAYGSKGAGGGVIPPDARLTFRIELLKVKHEPAPTAAPTPAS